MPSVDDTPKPQALSHIETPCPEIMAHSGSYVPDDRTKGNRIAKRTVYDADLVHGLIDSVPILHVSFNAPSQDPSVPQFPTILPMLGCTGQFAPNENPCIYIHGSSVARLTRLTAEGPLPVCVSATLVDGYVLSLTPFHNSCNYRSAICFGHATLVQDPEEVLYALRLITNNAIPDRWENSRVPPTKAEITSTGILKVEIESASAKTRVGGPDDDKSDLRDEGTTASTWVGVVPSYQVLGNPVPAEYNRVGKVPEYVADWVADVNSLNEQKAVDAVDEEGG
ncbi:hypothetical protein D0869_09830 [Hortaea werneckii]|uniref:Flavin-nucleotide-binding protein n=2 Tax=Hortaea werneckii TaxID=91943 RepID=A0A3M6WG98_HORWE|nr:hypothetical protein D0869_09830 [Hortaea werneckii]RMY14375.1 hypothetical protein D0867_07163 [Hortaea werneckii]